MEEIDFLNLVTPRVGPVNAVSLARDIRFLAIKQVLIEKLGLTQEQIQSALKEQFKKTAQSYL